MNTVAPDLNLSRYQEMEVSKISPSDVYQILRRWKDEGSFNDDNIGVISRVVARTLNDQLETPEGGEIRYIDYDANIGNSYKQADILSDMFGPRMVCLEEMRDSRGYLKQWRVVLKSEI